MNIVEMFQKIHKTIFKFYISSRILKILKIDLRNTILFLRHNIPFDAKQWCRRANIFTSLWFIKEFSLYSRSCYNLKKLLQNDVQNVKIDRLFLNCTRKGVPEICQTDYKHFVLLYLSYNMPRGQCKSEIKSWGWAYGRNTYSPYTCIGK